MSCQPPRLSSQERAKWEAQLRETRKQVEDTQQVLETAQVRCQDAETRAAVAESEARAAQQAASAQAIQVAALTKENGKRSWRCSSQGLGQTLQLNDMRRTDTGSRVHVYRPYNACVVVVGCSRPGVLPGGAGVSVPQPAGGAGRYAGGHGTSSRGRGGPMLSAIGDMHVRISCWLVCVCELCASPYACMSVEVLAALIRLRWHLSYLGAIKPDSTHLTAHAAMLATACMSAGA